MRFFEALSALVFGKAHPSKVDDEVDRYVTAAIDGGIDLLLAADGATLAEQSREAKGIHDALVGEVGPDYERDRAYVAGRLGSLVEVLGLAAGRCAPAGFEDMLRSERFKPLLEILARGATRNVDLARALGESEESVCRKLRDLREAGATGTTKRGREVFNTLLPAARAIVVTPPEQDAFDMTVLSGIVSSRSNAGEGACPAPMPRLDLVVPDSRAHGEPALAEAA